MMQLQQTKLVNSPRIISFFSRQWIKPAIVALRAFSDHSNQSRGGLPRFFSETLPSSKGGVVRVQGDEFWHMTKVLRLSVKDRIELFNGKGGLVEGSIERVDRTGIDFVAIKDQVVLHPHEPQWDVYAAFSTLKGGRADWLVEKCTELGASSVTPLLTERSLSISENRVDRLQRVIVAATKQCQRLHEMILNPPIKVGSLLPNGVMSWVDLCLILDIIGEFIHLAVQLSDILFQRDNEVAQSKLSFVAAAEATPLISTLTMTSSTKESRGSLIIGPEGDFTEQELKLITEAGATAVGLGPHRLRVETATISLLATLMLWSDSQ